MTDRERFRRWLDEQVEQDPAFLGYALRRYREKHGLDEAALAALLGCDRQTLARLKHCRRPDSSDPRFASQAHVIAAAFAVAVARLSDALHVDASMNGTDHFANGS